MLPDNVITLLPRPRGTRRCCAPRAKLSAFSARRQGADLALLASPVRLQLLHLLLREPAPVCVCDLTCAVGLKQPTVSHHLKLLKAAGLVVSEKRGVWSYWSARKAGLEGLKRRLTASLEALK